MSSDWGTISPKRIRKKLVGVMTGGVGTGQEFAKELAVGWKQLDTQTVIKPNPFEFRPSKLPYCPVVALAESKIVETRWGEDFFFNSGHAAHALYQRWLPLIPFGEYIWGNWQCEACNTEIKHSYKVNCPNCGNPHVLYTELELSLEYNNVVMLAHTDLVYWPPKLLPRIYDIKTCRENRLDGKGLPFNKHLHQIFTYSYLFEKHLGVQVAGIVLAYSPREMYSQEYDDFSATPTAYLWGAEWTERLRELTHERLHRAFNGRSAELYVRQNGFNVAAGQAILKSRPCTTLRDFKDWTTSNMNKKCKFWTDNHCSADLSAVKTLAYNLEATHV
jgi:hypothetical protein